MKFVAPLLVALVVGFGCGEAEVANQKPIEIQRKHLGLRNTGDVVSFVEKYAVQALVGEKLEVTFVSGPASGLYQTSFESEDSARVSVGVGTIRVVAERIAKAYFGEARNRNENKKRFEQFVHQADLGFALCWYQDVKGANVEEHFAAPDFAQKYTIPLGSEEAYKEDARAAMRFWRDIMALAGRTNYASRG